jgi:hypothetical protein
MSNPMHPTLFHAGKSRGQKYFPPPCTTPTGGAKNFENAFSSMLVRVLAWRWTSRRTGWQWTRKNRQHFFNVFFWRNECDDRAVEARACMKMQERFFGRCGPKKIPCYKTGAPEIADRRAMDTAQILERNQAI